MAVDERQELRELEELESLEQRSSARRSPMQMGLGAYGGERAKQEAVMGLVTQPIGATAAGFRGLAGMIGREDPQKTVEAQEALEKRFTYQPRTPGGQQALSEIGGAIGFPSRAAGAAGQAVMGATGSPGLGAATDVGLQALPSMLGAGFRGKAQGAMARGEAGAAAKRSMASTFDASIEAGKAENLKTYPRNVFGEAALLFGGKTGMRAKINRTNAPEFDRMSREEAGLAPDAPINRKTLKKAREVIAQPYEDLGKMSPAAGQLWREVQDLRVEIRDAWNSARTNVDRDAAKNLERQAAAKEQQIDKIAQMNFQPDMLQKLRDARVRLAKNYMVDEANIEGTGHVNADVYQRALNNERPISGKFDVMARFQNANDFLLDEMKESAGMAHGVIGASGHHAGAGVYLQIPGLAQASRALALSKIGQEGPAQYRPGIGARLSDIATRKPLKYLFPSLYGKEEE